MVKTNQPIILNREKITHKIAHFWDGISEGWRKIYGPHIHHGYYENNQTITTQDAQEKLIQKLTDLLEIPSEAKILDVGCGMGGTSIYLAKKYHAVITGITLSQKQVNIATQQAQEKNIKNVTFKIEDALSLQSFENNSMDVIWSLESCEQFFDKSLFIQQAFRVLKPGGKLMLATWCSDKPEYEGKFEKKYKKLCRAFDVPYMPTIEYYRQLLKEQNFSLNASLDWSEFVLQSWDNGIMLVNAYSFLQILKMTGWRGLRFAKQIKLMRDAFQENRIQYGVFVATKN